MYGANVTSSSIQSPLLTGPDPSDDVNLAAFIAQPGSQSICGALSKPEYLGLRNFGAAHAIAGDGLVAGIENFTTHDGLIRTVGGSRGAYSPTRPSNTMP
jgi:hypothetical protein